MLSSAELASLFATTRGFGQSSQKYHPRSAPSGFPSSNKTTVLGGDSSFFSSVPAPSTQPFLRAAGSLPAPDFAIPVQDSPCSGRVWLQPTTPSSLAPGKEVDQGRSHRLHRQQPEAIATAAAGGCLAAFRRGRHSARAQKRRPRAGVAPFPPLLTAPSSLKKMNLQGVTREFSLYLESQVREGLLASGVGWSLVLCFGAAYACYYLSSIAKVGALPFLGTPVRTPARPRLIRSGRSWRKRQAPDDVAAGLKRS